MSATPLTDAAISQRRFYETRGEWHGTDVFLYVAPEDARAIEEELTLQILTCKAEIETLRADAERWQWIRRKLCLTGNGDGTCAMDALNLPVRIEGWPEPGEKNVKTFCDAAIDAAIAKERTS